MIHTACMRCGALVELVVNDQVGDNILDEEWSVGVKPGTGMLAVVCADCMTDKEVFAQARRAAGELLDTAEEAVAVFKMTMDRIEAIRDDPDSQRTLAEMEARAEQARAMIKALDDAERNIT